MKFVTIAFGSLFLLLFTGCGSDESKVESRVHSYLAAFADGKGEEACDSLTGDGRRELLGMVADQLPESGFPTCSKLSEFVDMLGDDERNQIKKADVVDVRIDGDTATAYPAVNGQKANQVTLRKVDGDWKIDGGFIG